MDAETDNGEGRWMTYAELAALRGIDKNSAARLTFRRQWRRQRDNHGTVRVLVPVDWLEPSPDASRDVSDDASRDVSRDVSRVIKPLEDAIGLLREQLGRAEGRADRAEATAVALREQMDDLRAKLSDAQTELAAAQDQAEAASARALAAVAAEQALQQADTDRRARGLLARLRMAWRGG